MINYLAVSTRLGSESELIIEAKAIIKDCVNLGHAKAILQTRIVDLSHIGDQAALDIVNKFIYINMDEAIIIE